MKATGLDHLEVSLFEKINRLDGKQFETGRIKVNLHRARVLCNRGAHRTSAASAQEQSEDRDEIVKLAQHAEEVRSLVLQGMEFLYCGTFSLDVMPTYALVAIEKQQFKDLLYAATVGQDADLKYKAGLTCEGEADRRRAEQPALILTDEFVNELKFLRRLAATFYQSSFLLKPNVEAQFRYAQFVEQGMIDGDKKELAIEMIGKAAESGLGEACHYYGAILYEDKKDYVNAERFWLRAVQKNASHAYAGLWSIYLDGKACDPNPEKAMAFLRSGVEQADSLCLDQLGRCYHEGVGVEKDDDQARVWLQKAIDQGNIGARHYLTMMVDGGLDRMTDELALFGHLLSGDVGGARHSRSTRNRDPYGPCMCGSGKKYKWCCKDKERETKTKLDVFVRRI